MKKKRWKKKDENTAIYKYRYTFGESVLKLDRVGIKVESRYIFVIKIGTQTKTCYENRYILEMFIKIGAHAIQIGTI